jgi:hypothetical protein
VERRKIAHLVLPAVRDDPLMFRNPRDVFTPSEPKTDFTVEKFRIAECLSRNSRTNSIRTDKNIGMYLLTVLEFYYQIILLFVFGLV